VGSADCQVSPPSREMRWPANIVANRWGGPQPSVVGAKKNSRTS